MHSSTKKEVIISAKAIGLKNYKKTIEEHDWRESYMERNKGKKYRQPMSFEIYDGDIIYIVGKSGSGKSTLLKILAGYEENISGNLTFFGKYTWLLDDRKLKRLVGFVPQEDALYDGLTPYQTLSTYYRLEPIGFYLGFNEKELNVNGSDFIKNKHRFYLFNDSANDKTEVDIRDFKMRQYENYDIIMGDYRACLLSEEEYLKYTLKRVGLTAQMSVKVKYLSGGERKRVSIAIECLRDPKILILDEPDSGLDPSIRADIIQIIRNINKRGVTVLLSTHNPNMISFEEQLIYIGVGSEIIFQGKRSDAMNKMFGHPQADIDKMYDNDGDSLRVTFKNAEVEVKGHE